MGQRWWFSDVMVAVGCLTLLTLSACMNPTPDVVSLGGVDVPILCLYRRVTGMECIGCGMTRSMSFMANGQLIRAFEVNMFGPAVFVVIVAQIPLRALRLRRRYMSRQASLEA